MQQGVALEVPVAHRVLVASRKLGFYLTSVFTYLRVMNKLQHKVRVQYNILKIRQFSSLAHAI